MKKKIFPLLGLSILLLVSCFPYVYYDQDEVLIDGVDIDQTLEVAKVELAEGGFDAVLTIWAIRDQIITSNQAKKINEIYLKNIENIYYEKPIEKEFGTWHLAWAIADLYRNGSEEVKKELESAYEDARKRPDTLETFYEISNLHINGDKIYMGDIHGLGRAYARSHIVVPGNKKYLQSFEEFKEKKEKKIKEG